MVNRNERLWLFYPMVEVCLKKLKTLKFVVILVIFAFFLYGPYVMFAWRHFQCAPLVIWKINGPKLIHFQVRLAPKG